MKRKKKQTRRRRRIARMSDDQLLDLRFSDLHVKIEGTAVEKRIKRLYAELENRGIMFRPYFWASEEWFTPDGVPGIAVPFYLLHPRLSKLERSQMLEVEGETEFVCMRILRHEAGHAIDNAFHLHRKQRWRELFGLASIPYPKFYQPKPYSKSFVLHLDMWYAQAHPLEDFAETFAVWLTPGSRWQTRYKDWPALRKLEYVDRLMKEIKGKKPRVRTRQRSEPLHTLKTTLREHYLAKRMHYGHDWPQFYDRDLRRLFSADPMYRTNMTASRFLQHFRPELRKNVAKWTGTYQYMIDQIIIDMIDRCRELKLRLSSSPEQTRTDTLMLVAVQTMNYLHQGQHQVAL